MKLLARFLTAALLFTPASVAAQSADTLSGKVLDPSGASVADADVRVRSREPSPVKREPTPVAASKLLSAQTALATSS